MELAAMFVELVELEQQVKTASAGAGLDARHELQRVYPWRPVKPPELPAIWNWIDDGSYEIVDTARADDIIVVTTTIGVAPGQLDESIDLLVKLTDVFRATVDPALNQNRPLNATARTAKRVVTRTSYDDFDGVPALCMDMLIRVQLSSLIA